MLLFRDEGHLSDWLNAHSYDRGYALTLGTLWSVARVWYDGRLDTRPLSRTVDEKQVIFERAGLTGAFWRLPR